MGNGTAEISQNPEIDLSVVVLCYQSEEFAIVFCNQLLIELNALGIVFEIILVANYDSTDDPTPEITKKLAHRHQTVKFISESKTGKMGWDMKMGLEAANGKYIAVIDGDGQMPSSDIPLVYKIIADGQFDLVKTFRGVRLDSFYRKLLSQVYNLLFNVLFRPQVRFKDVNSKPKIFSKSCYRKFRLESNDWFTDAEIMIQAIEQKLKICEVSTVFYANERRPSYVKLGTVFEFLFNLLRYRFIKRHHL